MQAENVVADDKKPDLDALYQPPSEMIQKAVLDRLVSFHEQYLAQATFFCLATGRAQGLDASPRGGAPGFVKVLDQHTVAFADWPGNNRIESMRNLDQDERVAMLFLFPGLEIFLRINGRALVSTAPDLLDRLTENDRRPKAATVVAVDEVLMHCGKAINRAGLWTDAARLNKKVLPSVGKILEGMKMLGEAKVEQVDAHYEHVVRNDLY